MRPPRAIKLKATSFGRGKKKARAKPRDLETPIHEAIFEYLRFALLPGSMIHHSPNEIGVALEDKHRMAIIAKWKRLGMRKGWPDIEAIAAMKDGTWRLIMVEVKSEDGVLSQAQKDVRAGFKALGIAYCIARSVQDVETFLIWESIDKRARL